MTRLILLPLAFVSQGDLFRIYYDRNERVAGQSRSVMAFLFVVKATLVPVLFALAGNSLTWLLRSHCLCCPATEVLERQMESAHSAEFDLRLSNLYYQMVELVHHFSSILTAHHRLRGLPYSVAKPSRLIRDPQQRGCRANSDTGAQRPWPAEKTYAIELSCFDGRSLSTLLDVWCMFFQRKISILRMAI